MLEESLAGELPTRGALLMGTVLLSDPQGLVVDLGTKRDGVVPRADLDRLAEEGVTYKPGDQIAVVVLNPNDSSGNLVVSVYQAWQDQDWVEAERLFRSEEIWEGMISGYNRGGLIADFGELRAFVPASHVTELPRGLDETERQRQMAQLVGRTFAFKVIEVDRQRRRLVLSQRGAQKEWRERQRARLLDDLAEGQRRRGMVTGLRDFGAFVDLGGIDGLIHVSELAWQHIRHPRDVLALGQEVEVLVIKVDRERQRVGLSLKQLEPDPWASAGERFAPGQVVEGEVTRVASFGAFVNLGDGIEGLAHSSQIPAASQVKQGDRVQVQVLNVEPRRQRIGLSLMAADEEAMPSAPSTADLWEEMAESETRREGERR